MTERLLAAWRIIRESLSEAELVRLIESGAVDLLLHDVLAEPDLDRALLSFRQQIRQTVQESYTVSIKDLPKAGRVEGQVAVAFDHLSDYVRTAIQKLETPVLASLKEDVRETVRQAIARGLEEGKAPRTVARGIRELIGLGPTQAEFVQNLRTELETGKYADAARRKLLDHRFNLSKLDAMSASARAQRIDTIVEAYRKSMIAMNANTVAHTATMDSYRLGQDLSWRDAQENGLIPPNMELWKTWMQIHRPTAREDHIPLDGETVPFNEPYSNGSMIPGDQGEYNCGCLSRVFLRRAA